MTLPCSQSPKSICLLRLSAIGDVTHAVPVVRTLQHNWPETSITWIIGTTEYTLINDIEGVEFITFNKAGGLSAYYDLYKKLKPRHFDILLHMQVSLRASILSLMVKAPIRLGFDRPRAKNAQWLFTNHSISGHPRQHVLDNFLDFARTMGLVCHTPRWDIPIPDKANEKLSKWLNKDQKFLVINPSSSTRVRNWRNWDPEKYASVADYAYNHYNLSTVLTGGPAVEEKIFAEQIINASNTEPINLVGQTNLKELLALLSRATFVISPDTGPAHMANAVRTPVIGLYASSNPERTGPYNFRNLTVNCYPEAVLKSYGKNVDEIPWGQRVRDPMTMSLISLESVIHHVDSIMNDEKKYHD